MERAVILEGARTPMGRAFKGSFKDTRPEDLLATVLRAAVEKVEGLKPEQIDDVIIGCAFPEGEQGMNIARIGVFLAEFPDSVPAMTINRFCSSGSQAIALAAQEVLTGFSDIVIAGGVESMTRVKMYGFSYSEHPGLKANRPDAYMPMGLTAELVAERCNVSREDQDKFAVRSHERALAAVNSGRFDKRVVPMKVKVSVANPDGSTSEREVLVARDEGPRPGTTVEKLATLKPVFKENGTVTAGNASQMTDGAAAVVVTTESKAKELGVKPIAWLGPAVVAGLDPAVMGLGPIFAVPKLLKKSGLTLDDIDLIELNEAFASQAVACIRQLGLPEDKVNVNGGAIALGHPLGATGARLTIDLITEMEHRNAKRGIVTMCIGGGQGFAMLVERQ
ncbi:MAG TPA: thiolase family protein [Firmicutes bacterium]|nr:thiolase family protein [Bacillota bacterium]